MDASLLVRCSAAEGVPQTAARPTQAGPDAPAGHDSFLSVLDQAVAAEPPPEGQPPAPEGAPKAEAAEQPKPAAEPTEENEQAKAEGGPVSEGKGKNRKTGKREAPNGRSAPKAAAQAPAEAPKDAAPQAPAEASHQPVGDESPPADAQPAAAAKAPVRTASPASPPAEPGPKSEVPAPAPRSEQPAVAIQVARVPQAKPAEAKEAAVRKAPTEAPAPAAAHPQTSRPTAAHVQPAAATPKPADPQPTKQEGRGADEQPPKQAAPTPAEKTDATEPQSARAAPTEHAAKAPAPAPAPPAVRAARAPATHQTQALPLQPGADAVAVQAWRRYDAQAGDGYRQQVQTLAGRATGQVSVEIVRQAQMLRQNGSTTIRIQLNPPEMGRIRLEVRMRSEHLEVRMQVENPDVRQAMTRELAGLDRTLRDAQVDVQRFEVTDYQSGRQGTGRDGYQDGAPSGGGSPQLPAAGEQDNPALGWARISTSGAVDCLI